MYKIKKYFLFLFASILVGNTILAQVACTKENIQSIPGKWKEAMHGSTDHSAADISKEKILLADIITQIRSNFKWELKGGEITYNQQIFNNQLSYNPVPLKKIINASESNLFFTHYFCSNGKIFHEDFNTELRVLINEYPRGFNGSFFNAKIDANGYPDEDPGNNVYMESSILPKFKNGVWEYYGTDDYRDTYDTSSDTNIKEIVRFICKSDISPIIPMTRREYFSNWIAKYKHKVNFYENWILKIKARKDSYTDPESVEKDIQNNESSKTELISKLKLLEGLLKELSESELNKPAMRWEEEGVLFSDNNADNKPALYILKPNMAYFNRMLPKSFPQFFSIIFRVSNYYFGEKEIDNSHIPDKKFVDELKRMNVLDLLTNKLQPLIIK